MLKRFRAPRALAAAAAVAALALSGCSAASSDVPAPGPGAPAPASPTPASPATPRGASSLASLGFRNGPVASVFVPSGAVLSNRVDQENVVTLVFSAPAGAELADFYARTLPGGGFTLTGAGNGSLTFASGPWDGAFTTSGTVSGLTLRRN